MAGALSADDTCQAAFQYTYFKLPTVTALDEVGEAISGTLACLTVSLYQVMQNTSLPPTPATAMFKQLLSRLEALMEVVAGNVTLGVRMDLLPPNGQLSQLIDRFLEWIYYPVVLFLEEGGFVDYDPWVPEWWRQRHH